MAFTDIPMALFTRESGSRTNSMVRELKVGQTGQGMRETSEMEKRMAKAHFTLRTGVYLQASFLPTKLQGGAVTCGLTANHTPGSGFKTKCTARAISSGRTANRTSGLLSLTSAKDKVFFIGKTVECTTDSGRMANSTEKAFLSRETARSAKEYGRREGTCSGLTIEIT